MKFKPLLSVLALVLALAPPALAAGDDVVRVGVLTDMSSIFSDWSGKGSVLAATLAVEDFKAANGKLKVELISADHQNKAEAAAAIARRWVYEGVDVIADVPNSAAALAVSEIVRDSNKVLLVSGSVINDLTGKVCTPNTVHWTIDTWALANGTGRAVVQSGGDSWFFLTSDFAGGHALEQAVSGVVEASGGKVLGHASPPLNTADFSSFLLQAQASHAKVIGLSMSGGDFANAVKQASEFGIVQGGQKLAGLVVFLSDIHALGLSATHGLQFTEAFYWDLNEGTRAFGKRFAERNDNRYPTQVQAGVYASVTHYLKAAASLEDRHDGRAVVARMKEMPTEDALFGKGSIRADGRTLHDLYLFEVKAPTESKYPWDYYKLVRTIPAAEAFKPMSAGGCPLVASN
jgi:branched-chain amino acid transport system substrate-binding protein